MSSRIERWIAEKELTREFWAFAGTAFCRELAFAMYLFLYSLYLLDIGFDERQLGLVASAMTIGAMAATLPMGALARRMGLRHMLLAGFALTPLICVLRPFVPGERGQIVLAFALGATACYWPVAFAPAIAALTTEKNRPFAFGLMFSTGIGLVGLGGLVGGALPGRLERMGAALHIAGPADAKRAVLMLCCAIYALGVWPAACLRLRTETQTQGRPWRLDPFLLRFLPAIALWSLAAGAFIPFATAYLERYVHLSLTHIGAAYAASQVAQIAAILAAPAVFRHRGLVAGIAYTQVATAIALAGMAWTHAVPVAIVLYLGFSAFHWMGGPGIYSLLMDGVAESERSRASAAYSFVTLLCQAGASAAAGAGYVKFGYPAVLGAIAAIALLASGLFWALLREEHHGDAVAATPVEI